MRHLAVAVSILLLAPATARPCGGAFGAAMSLPDQRILVVHRAGEETYVFQPRFCGQAAEFGLILPIPTTLSADPALAGATLFAELDRIAAPNVVTRTECRGNDRSVGGAQGPDAGANHGTQVIDSGQVGIFDWVLLKADTAASFTDWLDANGFPHATSADEQFGHYVGLGWYFVAFKVTASDAAPPPDQTLCGDLGPIALSFAADAPVIPTRMAAVSTGSATWLTWRVYTIAAQQLGLPAGPYTSVPRYAGTLGDADVAGAAAVAAYAAAGDRLTKLDVGFPVTVTGDLTLVGAAAADYRETIENVVYEDCGSCRAAPVGAGDATALGLLLLAVGVLLVWGRRQG